MRDHCHVEIMGSRNELMFEPVSTPNLRDEHHVIRSDHVVVAGIALLLLP
jgi:hypothetical protein